MPALRSTALLASSSLPINCEDSLGTKGVSFHVSKEI